MIYVYGAVDDPERAAAAMAMAGSPEVHVVDAGQAACLVSEIAAAGLVAHDRVLRSAMAECTVVPFRFGTSLDGEAELVARMEQFAPGIKRSFSHLRGKEELALRARMPAAREEGGGNYLRRLAARREVPPPLANLHLALRAAAEDAVCEPDGQGGIKASYLVGRPRVDAFCRLVDERHQEVEGMELSLTGPWPPYSFVYRPETRPRGG